jgi:hypothetical protein
MTLADEMKDNRTSMSLVGSPALPNRSVWELLENIGVSGILTCKISSTMVFNGCPQASRKLSKAAPDWKETAR